MSVSGHIAQTRSLFKFQDMTPLFYAGFVLSLLIAQFSTERLRNFSQLWLCTGILYTYSYSEPAEL